MVAVGCGGCSDSPSAKELTAKSRFCGLLVAVESVVAIGAADAVSSHACCLERLLEVRVVLIDCGWSEIINWSMIQ